MKKYLSINLFLVCLLISLFNLMGCARLGTLNFEPHQYGNLPTKIIWIQVAGLQDDHITWLKFFKPSAEDKTFFEKASCVGKAWTYNLFELRPAPAAASLIQLTGKKKIKGDHSCEDFTTQPIWSYLVQNGYQAGLLESGIPENKSLSQASLCQTQPSMTKDYFKGTVLWKMGQMPSSVEKSALTFHAQSPGVTNFRPESTYYDLSCQKLKGSCYTDLSVNIEYLFEKYFKDKTYYFFLIRDFSYYEALKKKDMDQARTILQQIEKTFGLMIKQITHENRLLVLLTGVAPQNLEFPASGKDWAQLEKSHHPILYKESSFLAPVFSKGARAENFCGIFEEAEILQRIMNGMSVRP